MLFCLIFIFICFSYHNITTLAHKSMKKRHPYHALDKWAIELQSEGRHSVSLEELRKKFPKKSEAALKLNINRLIKKRSIVSVYRGYYLLIPPQYHREIALIAKACNITDGVFYLLYFLLTD